MGGSKLRAFGDPYSANVVLPEAAADQDDQVGGEHERRARRRGSAGARRAHDAGARRGVRRVRVEGLRVGPRARRRAEGEPREVAPRLLQRSGGADQRRRADVLHDQGDHEPLRAVAAGRELLGHRHRALRRVLALSRGDPADRSARARAVAARAVAAGSTAIARRCSWCPSWDATATSPATGSRTTAAATSPAGGCGSWRSARACRRAPAPNARSGRWTSPRPWREILGFKMPECEGRPLPSWRLDDVSGSERSSGVSRTRLAERTMQFNAGLTGDAAALARTHGEMLARLPATVHAFILVELQKWPTLFQPEQRYQRALLEHLSRLPKPELDSATAGIARIEAEAGGDQGHRAQSRRLPGRGAGAAAPARAAGRLAQRGRRVLPDHRPGARGPALSRRCAAASRRPDLWQRHCGPARQTVEPLQRHRRPRAAGPGGDAGAPNSFSGVAWRARMATARPPCSTRPPQSSPLDAWLVESHEALHALCDAGADEAARAAARPD